MKLNNAPAIELRRFANELIQHYGEFSSEGVTLSLTHLDDDDVGTLAAYFLETDDRDTSDLYATPNQSALDDDITVGLLHVLKANDTTHAKEFANLVRANVIKRYSDRMQDYLTDVCQDYEVRSAS